MVDDLHTPLLESHAAVAIHIRRHTPLIIHLAEIIADFITCDLIFGNVVNDHQRQTIPDGITWRILSDCDHVELVFTQTHNSSMIGYADDHNIGLIKVRGNKFIKMCITGKLSERIFRLGIHWYESWIAQNVVNSLLKSSMSRMCRTLSA